MSTLRGGLWVWVGILALLLLLGAVIGNGETAWQVTEYIVLSATGLLFLVVLTSGFLEMWKGRHAKRDD